ncbi:peptidylprolyl isomerase [Acidovorax sp. M2(2025)]|uniref:peptidylprolyl isomerase n=1 Tax=Acidovorax sp. M2(2025) TaxID=3411355 RepID=UPI003BF52F27
MNRSFLNIAMRKFLRNGTLARMAAVALLSAAVSMASAAEPLVKLANGESITQEDVSAYLERRVDLQGTARNVWGLQTALREMALVRALTLEGASLGVPREAGKSDLRFDDVYAQAIYTKLAPACKPPADEAESRKFFKDHPQAFRVPAMARLSRVILPASEKVEGEPAAAWLMKEAEAVASGKKTFEDLAKQAEGIYRLDPQGDLGWITLFEEDVSVLRVLAAAKQGEMVGPVREGDFAYLFKVNEKRDAQQLGWDAVAISVPTRAVTFCRQEASKKIREDLFKKYGVELDGAAIRALFTKQSAAK